MSRKFFDKIRELLERLSSYLLTGLGLFLKGSFSKELIFDGSGVVRERIAIANSPFPRETSHLGIVGTFSGSFILSFWVSVL